MKSKIHTMAEARVQAIDYANVRHWVELELGDVYSAAEAELWLNTPQGRLDGDTPLTRIREGKWQDVVAIIHQLQTGAFV